MQSEEIEQDQGRARSVPEICVKRAQIESPDDALTLIEEYYEAVQVVARDDRATLLRYLSDAESAIWIAYCADEPAGCILYRPLPQFQTAGEIKRLYVRRKYRARGVAGVLLRVLEEFAREHKTEWLYLDTKDDLTDAITFYRRHGYKPCARYNENPQATIFLRKRLPSG